MAETSINDVFLSEAAAAASKPQRELPIPFWALIVIIIIVLWIFCAVVHVVIADSRHKFRMEQEVKRMRDEARKIRKMKLSKAEEQEAWSRLHNESLLFKVDDEDSVQLASVNKKSDSTNAPVDDVWVKKKTDLSQKKNL